MEEDSGRAEAKSSQEDRCYPRYAVTGESSLSFFDLGLTRACKVMDLSLEGCRVDLLEVLPAGEKVEVVFKVEGNTFRFKGLVRWEHGRQAGIQFIDVSARRRAELADLIADLASVNPAPPSAERPGRSLRSSLPAPSTDSVSAGSPSDAGVERRADFRYRMETSAVLFLVRSGSMLEGQILDLSAGGCRIRIEEKFDVDLYARMEIEFQLYGQPFRLGGVVQRIAKDNGNLHGGSLGIRFVDLSPRKQEQVAALIAEINQARRSR